MLHPLTTQRRHGKDNADALSTARVHPTALTFRQIVPEKPCPNRVRRNLPRSPMGQQTNKIEKKKRRLAYLERKKERVKKAIVVAKKAARK